MTFANSMHFVCVCVNNLLYSLRKTQQINTNLYDSDWICSRRYECTKHERRGADCRNQFHFTQRAWQQILYATNSAAFGEGCVRDCQLGFVSAR